MEYIRPKKRIEEINSEANFRRLFDNDKETSPNLDVLSVTEDLKSNLLFFHIVNGGVPNLGNILKDGFKPADETGVETNAITQMDRVLGTDQATYFAVGTPNMYITESRFEGPILVYDSDLVTDNPQGYINFARVYVGNLRKDEDVQALLRNSERVDMTNTRYLEALKRINEFAKQFQQGLTSLDMNYIARFMINRNIDSILDLLTESRSWELIIPTPNIKKPKAIIFRTQQELDEAIKSFGELLNGITLIISPFKTRQINGSSVEQLLNDRDSSHALNIYSIYQQLNLSIGELRIFPDPPEQVINLWRKWGLNIEEKLGKHRLDPRALS